MGSLTRKTSIRIAALVFAYNMQYKRGEKMKEDKGAGVANVQGILNQQIEAQGSRTDLGEASSRSLGRVGG